MLKKSIVLLTALAILGCMVLPVSAAKSQNYVPSIERRDVPEVTVETDDPAYQGTKAEVHSYEKRDEISNPEKRKNLEDAFQSIMDAETLADLNTDLAALAQKAGVKIEDLVVRDLFDVSLFKKDGSPIDFPPEMKVLFSVEPTYNRFIALLCYVAGEWTLITKDINELSLSGTDNDTLKFLTDEFGAFAVVVRKSSAEPSSSDGPLSPQTGDASPIPAVVAVVVLAIGAAYAIFKSRKHA